MRIEIDTNNKIVKVSSGTLGEVVDFMKEHFKNWRKWQIIGNTIYYHPTIYCPKNEGIFYYENEYPKYKIAKTGEYTTWAEE